MKYPYPVTLSRLFVEVIPSLCLRLKSKSLEYLPVSYDSVFGKRVLTYWENRGTPDYSQMNEFMVCIENYIFLERGKPHRFKNV